MASKSHPILAFVALVALATGCRTLAPGVAGDTIYTGGHIVTVDDGQPSAEAVAVKAGKILAVGTRSQIESEYKGQANEVVDLAGRTLLPGFIDPHSHYFSSLTVAKQVNVYAPPAGPGSDIPGIVAELKRFRDEHAIPKGELIRAYGYDENAMPKGVARTRDDLDADFPDNPVMVGSTRCSRRTRPARGACTSTT